jgi:hypothetical protein
MQRACLAAEETLGQIVRIPKVEITDLRAIDADDAENMPGGDYEGPRVTRRHKDLASPAQAVPYPRVESRVIGRQPRHRIADHGRRCPPLAGIGWSPKS